MHPKKRLLDFWRHACARPRMWCAPNDQIIKLKCLVQLLSEYVLCLRALLDKVLSSLQETSRQWWRAAAAAAAAGAASTIPASTHGPDASCVYGVQYRSCRGWFSSPHTSATDRVILKPRFWWFTVAQRLMRWFWVGQSEIVFVWAGSVFFSVYLAREAFASFWCELLCGENSHQNAASKP